MPNSKIKGITKHRLARAVEFDAGHIRDISEAVYRDRLGKDLEKMLKEDADGGAKLRARSASYDPLTRSYLRAIKELAHD